MLLFHRSLVYTFDDSFPFSGLLSLNILLATKDFYFDWLIGIRHCIIASTTPVCCRCRSKLTVIYIYIFLHLTQIMRQQEIYRSSLSLNYLRYPAGSVIMKKSVRPCSCRAILLTWTLEMANFDIFTNTS